MTAMIQATLQGVADRLIAGAELYAVFTVLFLAFVGLVLWATRRPE